MLHATLLVAAAVSIATMGRYVRIIAPTGQIVLERTMDDVRQNDRFEVVESWCLGGGCLAHQWIRRLMIEK